MSRKTNWTVYLPTIMYNKSKIHLCLQYDCYIFSSFDTSTYYVKSRSFNRCYIVATYFLSYLVTPNLLKFFAMIYGIM